MPPSPPELDMAADCSASSLKQVRNSLPPRLYPFEVKRFEQRMTGAQQSSNPERVAELETEVADLRRELASLKQEKADLEILLETTAEHSDLVEAELHSTAIAALKQSEDMFRTISETAPVPILISRPEDGTILYANASVGQMFGIPAEEVLSRSAIEFYDDVRDRQRLLDTVARTGSVQNAEFQCKRADGTVFWVTASLQPLIFRGESVLLAALCDITQQKANEEALKRQMQDMQIEIDYAKRARQVAEIVESDYFKCLQAELDCLRRLEQEDV